MPSPYDFEVSELISLVLGVGFILWMLLMRASLGVPGTRLLLAGVLCVVGSNVMTVLEAFVWPGTLNLLEHALLAAAGLFAAVGSIRLAVASRCGEDLP